MDVQLIEAATRNDINTLYALIQQHAAILDDVDNAPFVSTPFHVAASEGHIKFAMEMMNLKPSFARKLNQAGFSPLHLALQNNHQQMVRVLVNADKDLVRFKGRKGRTPLHQAVTDENLDLLAEFLVACPECIKDVNNKGENALHIAARRNKFEAFQILVHWLRRNSHQDGDVWEYEILNSKNYEGNTLLHLAAMNNNPQAQSYSSNYFKFCRMIRLLINGKVKKNQTNLENLTALDILKRQTGTEEAQRILLGAGGLEGTALPKLFTLPQYLQSNIPFWELMYKSVVRQRKNLSNETRNALLVVAALILTATYQATLSPPGGISQGLGNSSSSSGGKINSTNHDVFKGLTVDGHLLGKSVMDSEGPRLILVLLSLPLGSFFGCFVFATLVISPTEVERSPTIPI
ncbi:hypothetical protein DITRI_Ditri09bG0109600 [Diplodiscus trichospermus]